MVAVFLTDNEVDGATLLKLTETMIAHLLPKMKHQVLFMEAREKLVVSTGNVASAVTGDGQSSQSSSSAAVEQNG